MRFILLMSLLVMLFVGGTAMADGFGPDPDGIVDTLDLFVTVDWINNKVVAEVYCFTDFAIIGSSIGFTWGGSTATLVMDSATTSPLLELVTLKFLYEDDNITTTNTNKRFVLATTDFGAGVPGDASGRRLWATYYFSMTWVTNDCVVFDTLQWSAASTNLYVNSNGTSYIIEFAGGFSECNPPNGIDVIPGDLPASFALSQNYPNPFNPTTEIKFDIPTRSHTTLKVYNILGREVETLVDEEMSPGHYVSEWDASEYSSGIFFYKLTAGDFVDTKKMVLVK